MLVPIAKENIAPGETVSVITHHGKRKCVGTGRILQLTPCGRYVQVEYSYRGKDYTAPFALDALFVRVSAREWKKLKNDKSSYS